MKAMKTTTKYIMYLRKSRADADYGDKETLARHRQRLMELCAYKGITDYEVIEEVGSADSIASRPGMMQLLSLVETGQYEAVICIDMDRLSRGNGADQALLINTLKYSGTKVITPLKEYDFENDSDETFAEFSLFFAKNEYRTIKRRMMQGRIDAVKEGKYCSSNPPYGYQTYKLKGKKGFSLEIVPEEAEIVKQVFYFYAEKEMSSLQIARWLNAKGIAKRNGRPWKSQNISKMLGNPTYIGKIRFQNRKKIMLMQNGIATPSTPRNPEPLICDGMHEAIIDEELFKKVQEIKKTRHYPRVAKGKETRNPFIGILKCKKCGRSMVLRSPDHTGGFGLFCPTEGCQTVGTYLRYVEESVIESLGEWLKGYEVQSVPHQNEQKSTEIEQGINSLAEEIKTKESRLKRIYTAYEDGAYTLAEFKERTSDTKQELERLGSLLEDLKAKLQSCKEAEEAKKNLRPTVKTIVEHYYDLPDALEKNRFLSAVIDHIDYSKGKRGNLKGDTFTLDIYPKIPQG